MKQIVRTPAGALELTYDVDGVEPHLVRRQGGTTVREQWSSPGHLDISVIQADISPPSVREHGPVDGFVATVWALDASRACGPLTITARLTDAAGHERLNGNNGEWLEAVSYEGPGLSLTVGTQDDEALLARAQQTSEGRLGPALPSSWAPALAVPWQGEFGARPDPLGLRVYLPPLLAGEHADLHLAVAWSRDPDGGATWFAVDTNPTQILDALADGIT